MVRTYQRIFSISILSIVLSMNIGCASRKLLKENERIIKECEQEKNYLNEQAITQAIQFKQTKQVLQKEVEGLQKKMNHLKRKNKLAIKEIMIREEKKRLIVSLPDRILFTMGSFKINKNMKPMLKILAEHIRKYPNRLVMVEGHTCNLPIHNENLPTNWELSARRSTEVVRYFIEEEKLPPQQFSALGLGEYHPQAANNSEKERMKNRRVEIVIFSEALTNQIIK